MNREDIIRIAKECGLVYLTHGRLWMDAGEPGEELENFVKFVIAAAVEQERKEFAVHAVDIARRVAKTENEACAQICLLVASHMPKFKDGGFKCCEAIRARGAHGT